jgi:predicted PurR-regulated permease PerM
MLTTQDIFFIILAFCALWFTVFICWALYQAAQLIKRIHVLVDEMRAKVHNVEQTISGLKSRFEGNLEMVSGIAASVRKIMDALKIRGGSGE